MTRQYDSWNIAPPADGIFEDPEGPCIIWVTFCDICVCVIHFWPLGNPWIIHDFVNLQSLSQ